MYVGEMKISIESDIILNKRLTNMTYSDKTSGSGKRTLFMLLCHGSIFLASVVVPFAIPLGIYLLFEDSVIKESAKETLNYFFNIWVYGAIAAGLGVFFTALVITAPIAWLIGAAFFAFHWIPPIFAILSALNNPNEPYRYPFIWRVL
jgi:uncharacterized protein